MKAYMSVPGVRAVCCIGPVRDSQHAEAEARMLLSATVNEYAGSDPRLRGEYVRVERGAKSALLALQEALAAFCDDGQGY